MASVDWERPSATSDAFDAPTAMSRSHVAGPDPYEATVERLFALLEENQIAIQALAQAWRHTSRALELTKAQLANAEQRLATEMLDHGKAAG